MTTTTPPTQPQTSGPYLHVGIGSRPRPRVTPTQRMDFTSALTTTPPLPILFPPPPPGPLGPLPGLGPLTYSFGAPAMNWRQMHSQLQQDQMRQEQMRRAQLLQQQQQRQQQQHQLPPQIPFQSPTLQPPPSASPLSFGEDDFNTVLALSNYPPAPTPQQVLHTFRTDATIPPDFPAELKLFLGDWYNCKVVMPPTATATSYSSSTASTATTVAWQQFHYQHLTLRPDFSLDYEYAMRYGNELFSRGLVEFHFPPEESASSSSTTSSSTAEPRPPKLWQPVPLSEWRTVWSQTTSICKQFCDGDEAQVPRAFLTKVTFPDQVASGPAPNWKKSEIPLSKTAPEKYMCLSSDGSRLFTNLLDPKLLMMWTRLPVVNPK